MSANRTRRKVRLLSILHISGYSKFIQMRKQVLFMILFVANCSYANTYVGIVLSKKNNEPVGYVNIGIVGKGVGTVSDENGRYALTFDDQLFATDSIRFSYIGLSTQTIAVSDFVMQSDRTIYLFEQSIELKTVEISSVGFKDKTFGHPKLKKGLWMGFRETDRGYEIGFPLRIKRTTVLKEFNAHVKALNADSLFFRFNVYDLSGDSPILILNEPIYLRMPIVSNQITADISQYNICVENDVLITLEQVNNSGQGPILFPTSLFGSIYYRFTSHGKWEKAPMSIGFSVKAKVQNK